MTDTGEKKDTGKSGMSTGAKVLLGAIILVVLVALLAVFTLTIAVVEAHAGSSFPYVTTYRVTLPDGQPVTIGSSQILVVSIEDELFCDVDGTREKLVVGQERVISPRHARISVLGIPLIEADFQITLRYLGSTGKNANFDMTVKTSKQVPEFMLRQLIPQSMNAQPV
jgi:hypothetical protein